MINDKGQLDLPDTDAEGEITITTSFESLSGDAVIAELQEEVKDWDIDIPEEDYPDFEGDPEEVKHTVGIPQSLITQETAQSLAFSRLTQQLADDIESRVLIREETPLAKFLRGIGNIYIHVIDFTSEFEYKGKKYPGLIFLHEKKTLQEIFPPPSKAFCMVGWTFGDIPVVCTEFVEIDTYKNIPIFYPVITKDRLLMIANLGFYDEKLPSIQTVKSAKNLIELEIAYQLIQHVEFLEKRFTTHEIHTKKMLRKEMGIFDRAMTTWTKLRAPEKQDYWWLLPFVAGLAIGFLAFPYVEFLWRSIIGIFS